MYISNLTTLRPGTTIILTFPQDFLFKEGQGGLAAREFLTQLPLVALLVGFVIAYLTCYYY